MYQAIREAPQKMAELDQMTVETWLQQCHQSERARRASLDLIAIATLN